MAARKQPITKVKDMTELIFMPMSWLVSKSFATARMAMPIFVWFIRNTSARTVFGGIGSIPGAVIGAFIIGICENIIKAFGQSWTVFSDAFTFVLLIVVLLVKPTGIFGEKATDKV
mgnify:CR=1 FL=1